MRSVISSELIKVRPQSGGTTKFCRWRVVIEDNNSQQFTLYRARSKVPAAYDPNDATTAIGESVLNDFIQADIGKLLSVDVVDVVDRVDNLEFATKKEATQALIWWMVTERDPRIVIHLEDFITALKAQFVGDNQGLAAFLGKPLAYLQKVNARVAAILEDNTKTVKENLAAFDLEQEEV